MIIEIDDSMEGKERRKQLVIQPIIYALSQGKNKVETAKFLGISIRTLTDIINRYPELNNYKCAKPFFMRGWSDEKIEGYIKANKDEINNHTRRWYDAWRSNRSSGSSKSAS